MKKVILLLTVVLSMSAAVTLNAQNQNNPFIGAWQQAKISDTGTITYYDRVKVFTPTGLLKGLGNVQTKNDGYIWLDGSYNLVGNMTQGRYTEHCKWHENSSYIDTDVEFLYEISHGVLTLTYQSNPEFRETWVHIVGLENEPVSVESVLELEINKAKNIQAAKKAYERDKANYANKPFELTGLWKKGREIVLKMYSGADFMASYKEFKNSQHKAWFDLKSSEGDYILFCEDGFVFEPNGYIVPKGARLDESVCSQRSFLAPNELGKDAFWGRETFYSLGDHVYQALHKNAVGNYMQGPYYWKPNTEDKYFIKLSDFQKYKEKDEKEKDDYEKEDYEADDDLIVEIVEENAMFPGGDAACYEWLAKHLKYPAKAIEEKISGRVLAQFYLDTAGSVKSVDILRSPSSYLSQEVSRVLYEMPAWKPAKINDMPKESCFMIPFQFVLRDKEGKKIGQQKDASEVSRLTVFDKEKKTNEEEKSPVMTIPSFVISARVMKEITKTAKITGE